VPSGEFLVSGLWFYGALAELSAFVSSAGDSHSGLRRQLGVGMLRLRGTVLRTIALRSA
jgi:hypothetical protein